MFTSNQIFRISGDNRENLIAALRAALTINGGNKDPVSYHLSKENGLLFGWTDKQAEGWTPLPAPAKLEYLADTIEHYLKGADARVKYDALYRQCSFGDGDVQEGWILFFPDGEDCQRVKGVNLFYCTIAVIPMLTHYAK